MIARRWLALLVLPTLFPASASASKPRLRLERVDARACASSGVVDVYLAELELEGVLRDRPPLQFRLLVDGRELPDRPQRVTRFRASSSLLRLTLVLENTASYAASMEQLRRATQDLLRALPATAQVSVIVYDWQVRRIFSAGTPRQAAATLDAIDPSRGSEVDLALDEALTLGLRTLGPQSPGVRRLLVVVSDGINRSMKRDVFRSLGSRALQAGIPIHPIAFSPIDERGPLLNLGELAKRSRGTLRWARQPAALPEELQNLTREINDQLVLAFRVPDSCRAAHRLQVSTGDLISEPLAIAAAPTPARAGRSWLRIVLFGAGLLLALSLLTLLALWLARGSRPGPGPPPPRGRSKLPARTRNDTAVR
jgi:hypothetical protein